MLFRYPFLSLLFCFLAFSSLYADEKEMLEALDKRIFPQQFEVKKAKVGEIELAYYTRGQGKPLVMIMGFKGTMAMWDPALLEQLEKHYQLILFDNRGVGFSSDSVEDRTTIPQMADDTAGLIKALGFNRAYILGWSMGARIAEQLTIRHPEIVEKLVLCAPNPGGKHQAPITQAMKQFTKDETSAEKELALLFPDNPEGKAASQAFQDRLRKAIIERRVPYDLTISNETISRQIKGRSTLWDSEANYEALAHIRVPTLVAAGIEDVISPPQNGRITANQIPFAWSAFFTGGHTFLFQSYEQFADLVLVFLE